MSAFVSEIAKVQSALDRLQDEEVEHFRQTRLDFDRRREPLLLRLSKLRALNDDTLPEKSVPEAKSGSPTRSGKATDDRKPTLAVILDLLAAAEEPVPSSAIDSAVIEAGWSKAASNKAKDRMRVSGLIAVDKRHYTITEAGREKHAGLGSE